MFLDSTIQKVSQQSHAICLLALCSTSVTKNSCVQHATPPPPQSFPPLSGSAARPAVRLELQFMLHGTLEQAWMV